MLLIIVYIIIGMIAGLILGMLGTGSSLVILPILSLIFPKFIAPDIALPMAVATSVAVLVVGSAVAAVANVRKGYWDKRLSLILIFPCMLGALVAPLISHYLPSHWLRYYIAIFILYIAIKRLFFSRHTPASALKSYKIPQLALVACVGAIFCGVAGVAVGIILVPYLLRYCEYRKVIGTNVVVASGYATITMLGYIVTGWSHHVAWSLGYVYLPAFAAIAMVVVIMTPLGVALSHRLPKTLMQKLFYWFLLVAGMVILF